jgi:hypothetical protein
MITEPHARLQHQESNASQATKKPNPAQTKSQHWQYKQNIILNCAIPAELSSTPRRSRREEEEEEEEEENIQLRCRKPLKLETTIA